MKDYMKELHNTPSDSNSNSLNRREFIKLSGGAAVAMTVPNLGMSRSVADMPLRPLGKTGEKISMLTLGGHHIGLPEVSEEQSIEIIRTAVDEGVNLLDNAWRYHKGRSEELMGKALKDGYRDKVLLMTKFTERTLDGIKRQLEESLKRLGTDRIDLMQFHHVAHQAGVVDAIYKNGLPEWAMEQRDQGVFKFIGFTGHCHPQPLIDMIERGFEWDTIQFPVNIGDHHQEISFERDLMPLAVEKNISVLAMKTNGFGLIGKSGVATPGECIRYALSLPIASVVSGMDTLKILKENIASAKSFKPFSEKELAELRERAKNTDKQLEHYRKDI